MSYIDTFDHEFIGFFGGLPIYHPLTTINDNPPASADFNCNPSHLVLGGGGGEHPGLVLQRPDCAVAHFLAHWLSTYEHTLPALPEQQSSIWYQPWDAFLDQALSVPSDQVFVFADWDVRTHHHFYERCCSSALFRPYRTENDGWFEWWLAACFGEVILFSLPQLFPLIDTALPDVRSYVTQPLYLNVLTPLPGMTTPHGRISPQGKIKQGVSRWWLS